MRKLLFLLLFPVICYPADTASISQELVVYSSMVASYGYTKTNFKIGKLNIQDAGGQPFLMNMFPVCTTNYWIINLSTNAQAQNTFLNNANVKKCYRRTSVTRLIDTDGIVSIKTDTLAPCPSDLYQFQVYQSTP